MNRDMFMLQSVLEEQEVGFCLPVKGKKLSSRENGVMKNQMKLVTRAKGLLKEGRIVHART